MPARSGGRGASAPARAETVEAEGCSLVLRRVDGPLARELFVSCAPAGDVADAGRQAEAIQRALAGVLEGAGGSYASVVSETVFYRDLGADLASVRSARERVPGACPEAGHRPARSEIEQPPLADRARLEVAAHAVLPHAAPLQVAGFDARSGCECADCARAHGIVVRLGEETRFHASGLCGAGADAYAQTLAMFEVAEDLLAQADLDFGDVARTWIWLREMDRDYAELNRARRAFFASRGIDPPPASTGIGGAPAAAAHDLCLGVHALRTPQPERTVMSAPTLNEAPVYGSDFARGMRVVEANKIALHVSGTASIDEAGRSAHPGDVGAQAERMLVNVTALLDGQGASFADVVSAITYVKHPEDGERVKAVLRAAGYEGFPHALVVAPICRPDLLCETEALAVLPRA